MDSRQQKATETNAGGEATRSVEAVSAPRSATLSNTDTDHCPTAYENEVMIKFWLFAWLGTSVAGGMFGVVLACWFVVEESVRVAEAPVIVLLAFLWGVCYAGMLAMPLHASAVVVTWALWLSRFGWATASMSGAATGVLAITVTGPVGMGMGILLVAGAGLFGGLGTFASLHWYQTRTEGGRWLRRVVRAQPWRFSLSEMLRHMAVLAVLFAFWAWVFNTMFVSHERPLQPNEVRMDDPSNAMPAKKAINSSPPTPPSPRVPTRGTSP